MKVMLTRYEASIAVSVGCRRMLAALFDRRREAHGADRDFDPWVKHIEGAAGEMAVAKALGRYWSGSVDTFHEPDVGTLHVRTRSADHYDLIVRPADGPGIYVLVTGRLPTYLIRGWIRRADVQRAWLRDVGDRGAPAYFVPQTALSPIHQLQGGLYATSEPTTVEPHS